MSETITVPYYSSKDVEVIRINGLHYDADGVWRYYINDKFQNTYTGLVPYDGEQFYVIDGVLVYPTGLAKIDGT